MVYVVGQIDRQGLTRHVVGELVTRVRGLEGPWVRAGSAQRGPGGRVRVTQEEG